MLSSLCSFLRREFSIYRDGRYLLFCTVFFSSSLSLSLSRRSFSSRTPAAACLSLYKDPSALKSTSESRGSFGFVLANCYTPTPVVPPDGCFTIVLMARPSEPRFAYYLHDRDKEQLAATEPGSRFACFCSRLLARSPSVAHRQSDTRCAGDRSAPRDPRVSCRR